MTICKEFNLSLFEVLNMNIERFLYYCLFFTEKSEMEARILKQKELLRKANKR